MPRIQVASQPEPWQLALGERIRLLRGQRSLEKLAKEAGISDGTLGNIERGEVDPQVGTLLKLMKVFGLKSLEGLFGEIELPSASLYR